MPALIVIGFWFILQFAGSFSTPGTVSGQEQEGGVAYMAHIGGFLAGLAMAFMLKAATKFPRIR
jgi:membrane associated rhomboid family serine protease